MTTFFRLLHHDDKAAALRAAVAALHQQQPPADTYAVDPASFAQVPGSPFAYWVSEKVRRLFTELSRFESKDRHACVTNPAGNDHRYFRTSWEIPAKFKGRATKWVNMLKGGDFSRYYSNIHLVVDWDDKEQTFLGFEGTPHRPLKRLASADYFFIPGITYSKRSQVGFSARILPAGCIFHAKGPGIFCDTENNPRFLALMNSQIFHNLLLLQMTFGSYEVGVIQRTPVPDLDNPDGEKLGTLALACVNLKRGLDTATETSHVFQLPALLQACGDTLAARGAAWAQRVAEAEQQLAAHQHEIDDIAFTLYGIAGDDRAAIEAGAGGHASENDASEDEDEDAAAAAPQQFPDLAADLLSYLVGGPFGRWDMRYATGAARFADLPDPFAPLPVCSPAMLTGSDGLPLTAAPPDYPLPIAWDGILVDDPDHESDIVRRVGQVLELVWGERAEAIAQEACAALGVAELRDYFRRPGKGGFWDDHIKRYSKSRRKAPIYWLLQSAKKNYALWLYYHRLDSDILYKALLNYVEPKIRLEEHAMQQLVGQRTLKQGRELKQLERQIERQEAFISELRDFETRLRRVADLHLAPDLNDGVVLNIAPLWDVVPWKEAKKYWDELLKGKYEWSSIGTQLRTKGMVK